MTVTKEQLINAIAKKANISKTIAEKSIKALATITKKSKPREILYILDKTLPRTTRKSVHRNRIVNKTGYLHVIEPATANEILRSLKIQKKNGHANKKLSR